MYLKNEHGLKRKNYELYIYIYMHVGSFMFLYMVGCEMIYITNVFKRSYHKLESLLEERVIKYLWQFGYLWI